MLHIRAKVNGRQYLNAVWAAHELTALLLRALNDELKGRTTDAST